MHHAPQRLTPPWQPWEALPVALIAVAASVVAATVLAAVLGGVGGLTTLLIGLAFQVALAGITVIWVSVRHPGWVPALGLRSRRPAKDLAVGAAAGAGMFLFIAYVVGTVVALIWRLLTGHDPAPPSQLAIDFGVVEIVVGVFVVVVGASVGEELFYRGFLYAALRRRFGAAGGASLSAVLFGLSHASEGWVLVPLLTVFGVGLAALYERRGSLVAPMAAHGMFNLVGYTLLLMDRM